MSTPAIAAPAASRSPFRRLAPYGVVGVGWAALHAIASQTVLAQGLDRPLVLIGGGATVMLVAGVLVAAALVGVLSKLVAPVAFGRDALYRFGLVLGLTCWSISTCMGASGRSAPTMDQWLMIQNPQPDVLSGRAYGALLPDMLLLAAAAAVVIACLRDPRAWGRSLSTAELVRGIQAGGITLAVGGVGLFFLNGPQYQKTFQFQTFFAAWASLYLGALAARHATQVTHPIFYWPVPFLLGAIGLVFAAFKPGLSGEYAHLNMIPVWGLARPLPIELIGFGLIGVLTPISKVVYTTEPASSSGPPAASSSPASGA